MIPPKGTRHLRLFSTCVLLFILHSTSECKPSFPFSVEPIIRVNLADNAKNPTLQVHGNFKLNLRGIEIATVSNAEITFTYSQSGIPVAKLPNQQIGFPFPIKLEPIDTNSNITKPDSCKRTDPGYSEDLSARVEFDFQSFPGSMEIIPEKEGTFRVINIVPLETYLRGVVPDELVNNLTPDEFQACMAQAIAARNFAFYKMNNHDSSDFDVYSDTRDQVYSGVQEYKSIADSAIQLTSGMIVEYDGQPARCFFHSSCGGHTESVQNIWQGQPSLPYLQGVSDIDSATGSPYCIYSPNFFWTDTYSRYQIDEMFRENLNAANPTYANSISGLDVTDIKVLNRFGSSRVDSMKIVTSNGNVYYVRGDRTRYFFRNSDGALLRSSLFRISISRDKKRRIVDIVLKGQGTGHGVGMCQWGAIGMSRLGYSYLQILSHYYPGTVVKKVY